MGRIRAASRSCMEKIDGREAMAHGGHLPQRTQPVGDHAGDDILGASRWKTHDELDGQPRRIARLRSRLCCRQTLRESASCDARQSYLAGKDQSVKTRLRLQQSGGRDASTPSTVGSEKIPAALQSARASRVLLLVMPQTR
jgi:hypothetical protein